LLPDAAAGAGGITICEVHLRHGPGYGLLIEPCTEDEIRHHVTDFANFLLNPAQPSEEEAGAGAPGISREVERALRSMTGLRRRRAERKPDGTVIPATDKARELAATMPDAKSLSVELLARMIGLLHEMVPTADPIAVLVDPNFVSAETQVRDVQEAAARLSVQLVIVRAGTENEIDAAFVTLVRERAGAVLVCAAPFFYTKHKQLVLLAARQSIPVMYERREFAEAGGLMSYGTSLADAYRQMGVYAGRILTGDKPADLPIVQLTKFEFVINLKTAKALGLQTPDKLLALADEAIE
jgi:hypothetical protein